MTLRTGEDTLIWRRKFWIALCGGIVLEEALDLSSDRILNEWNNPVIRYNGYKLSNSRWNGDRGKGLLSFCFVQPCSVAHTSSYPIFTGGTFPGRKSLWCGADYSPFYSLLRPRMNRGLYPLLHKSSRIFAILRIFCVEENIKCRSKCEKTAINTTKYLLDSVGGKLVTTTCFSHQVAIVSLYTLK